MGCAALRVPFSARRRQTGPLVDLVVGSRVSATAALPSEKKVIFVFGGPGSRKGQIVNDLAGCFGFEMISAEKLVMAYFARHLHLDNYDTAPLETAQRVEEMLKGDPSLVSLWLLLELLGQELDSRWRPGAVFLADPVPNLRYMLPSKRQLRRCQRDMQLFEKQKRYQEYTENVHDLLQYFREANRLVTAAVPRDPSLVSEQLVDFLVSLGFVPRCTLDPNLIFSPATKSKRRPSRSNVILQSSPKQGIGSPATSPIDRAEPQGCSCLDIIRTTSKEAHEGLLGRPTRLACQPSRRFFTIRWQPEKLAEDCVKKQRKGPLLSHARQVLFSGIERLEGDKPARAVATPSGETCLFPEDTDWAACRQVALLCARHLHWQCTATGEQRNGAEALNKF